MIKNQIEAMTNLLTPRITPPSKKKKKKKRRRRRRRRRKEKLLANFQNSCVNVCHLNSESVVHIFATSKLARKITLDLTNIHVLTISKYIVYIFIILRQR
jgi:hypothetical protein